MMKLRGSPSPANEAEKPWLAMKRVDVRYVPTPGMPSSAMLVQAPAPDASHCSARSISHESRKAKSVQRIAGASNCSQLFFRLNVSFEHLDGMFRKRQTTCSRRTSRQHKHRDNVKGGWPALQRAGTAGYMTSRPLANTSDCDGTTNTQKRLVWLPSISSKAALSRSSSS